MPDPYCLAMVLCDAAHRDPGSHKFTLLGTFNNISAASFPTTVKLCVYFAITDGLGPTMLRVQLAKADGGFVDACSDEDDDSRVFKVQTEIDLENPLVVLESTFTITTTIPQEGLYHCELWANNTVLMSRRLTATLVPSAPQQPTE